MPMTMTSSIAARDNVIVRGEGECMPSVEVLADMLDAVLERNKDRIAKHISDTLIYGHSTLELE